MDEMKSIKSLPFSGKKSEFPVWKFIFLACCAYQKFEGILLHPQVIAPNYMEFLDPKDPGDVLLMDIRKQNVKAYVPLSLSISQSDTITFNAVQNPVTTDLPSGDAKQAWNNICEINQPATKADQHDFEEFSITAYYMMKHRIQISGCQS
jgi:hypothetical protein